MSKSTPRSTQEIASKRFVAHGEATFHIEGRLLITRGIGPFNAELIEKSKVLLREVTLSLCTHSSWRHLVIFQKSALASPETLDVFTKMLQELSSDKLSPHYTAHVFGLDVEGGKLMSSVLSNCYFRAGLPYAYFTAEEEARIWLDSKL